MPGPVSDSYDPEFGTGAVAAEVASAIREVRRVVTESIGSEELKNIVEVVRSKDPELESIMFSERELRIIRFCLDRALESI